MGLQRHHADLTFSVSFSGVVLPLVSLTRTLNVNCLTRCWCNRCRSALLSTRAGQASCTRTLLLATLSKQSSSCPAALHVLPAAGAWVLSFASSKARPGGRATLNDLKLEAFLPFVSANLTSGWPLEKPVSETPEIDGRPTGQPVTVSGAREVLCSPFWASKLPRTVELVRMHVVSNSPFLPPKSVSSRARIGRSGIFENTSELLDRWSAASSMKASGS